MPGSSRRSHGANGARAFVMVAHRAHSRTFLTDRSTRGPTLFGGQLRGRRRRPGRRRVDDGPVRAVARSGAVAIWSVTLRTPTTAGMPSSRAAIAAWLIAPPCSVTSARRERKHRVERRRRHADDEHVARFEPRDRVVGARARHARVPAPASVADTEAFEVAGATAAFDQIAQHELRAGDRAHAPAATRESGVVHVRPEPQRRDRPCPAHTFGRARQRGRRSATRRARPSQQRDELGHRRFECVRLSAIAAARGEAFAGREVRAPQQAHAPRAERRRRCRRAPGTPSRASPSRMSNCSRSPSGTMSSTRFERAPATVAVAVASRPPFDDRRAGAHRGAADRCRSR